MGHNNGSLVRVRGIHLFCSCYPLSFVIYYNYNAGKQIFALFMCYTTIKQQQGCEETYNEMLSTLHVVIVLGLAWNMAKKMQ